MLAGKGANEDPGEQKQDSSAEHDVHRSVGACDRFEAAIMAVPYQLARRRARV